MSASHSDNSETSTNCLIVVSAIDIFKSVIAVYSLSLIISPKKSFALIVDMYGKKLFSFESKPAFKLPHQNKTKFLFITRKYSLSSAVSKLFIKFWSSVLLTINGIVTSDGIIMSCLSSPPL